MKLVAGFVLLAFIALCCVFLEMITMTISCDTAYTKNQSDIKRLIILLLLITSSTLNFSFGFLLHRIMIHRWNFLQTAKDIIRFRFSYQSIKYFSFLLFFCVIFAILSGFLLKFFLAKVLKSSYGRGYLDKRRKALLFSLLTIIALVSIGSYMFSTFGFSHIVINEICANNQTAFITEEGKSPDYIEFYNTGFLSCELKNLYLSDDEDNLKKKELPNYELLPGQYFLISLDGDIDFSLKKNGGETLILSDSSGNILDQIHLPETKKDFSYARQTDGGTDWKLLSCTPGTTNAEASLWVEAPVFSHTGGFYSEEFHLEISSQPGTTVYYTTDGSTPSTDSSKYTEPVRVYNRSSEPDVYRAIPNVTTEWKSSAPEPGPTDKAFIIRAVAVGPKGEMSEPITATYLVGLEKYQNRPVISLVSDPDNLWGADGIYVTGQAYDDWYLGAQEGEAPDVNYKQRGRGFEREVHFEYFSDYLSFSQNAGLRVTGASSRRLRLKTLSLYARKEYSGSRVFDENIFPDVSTHKLSLRGGYANSLCQALVRDRNVATQRYIWASVFLNGEFWYNCNLLEKYDSCYFEERYGIFSDNVIVVNQGLPSEGTAEDFLTYSEPEDFLSSHDMADPANYEEFGNIVDLQSYIDFMCINIYVDNMDITDTKNTVVWRSRDIGPGEYQDGKWRWALYDLDAMEWGDFANWGMESQQQKNSFCLIPKYTGDLTINQLKIYKALKVNPDFCRQFVLTFMDLVNTNFRYEHVKAEMELYGSDFSRYQGENWNTRDKEYYEDFFLNRPSYIVPYMAEEFNLTGSLETVTLSVNDSEAGHLQLNTITPDLSAGTWQGDYYTDYPVTVTAVAHDGYEFVGWEGDIHSTELSIEAPVLEGGIELHGIFKKVR